MPDERAEGAAIATYGTPVTRAGLALRGLSGAVLGCAGGYALSVLLASVKAMRGGHAFAPGVAWHAVVNPARAVDYVDLFGPPVVGLLVGVAVAAYVAARRGVRAAR